MFYPLLVKSVTIKSDMLNANAGQIESYKCKKWQDFLFQRLKLLLVQFLLPYWLHKKFF